MKHIVIFAASTLAIVAAAPASATILIDSTNAYSAYTVGQSGTTSAFAGYLAAQPGGFVAGTLGNAAQTAAATGILVNLRNQGARFSAAELTNLQTAVAAGKRVLVIGENGAWGTWNTSIADAFAGASYSASAQSGIATPVVNNGLTAGITSVNIAGGATIIGGQQLFSLGVASLFGPASNALVAYDVNVFANASGGNDQFQRNVAAFLGAAPDAVAPVPEPATWMMMLVGFGMIGATARYRRRSTKVTYA